MAVEKFEEDMNAEGAEHEKDSFREKMEKMDPIMVRMPHSVAESLRGLAKESHCSVSEIVRCAAEAGLIDYLHAIRFVDYAQGEEIRKDIRSLIDKIAEIEFELKREGVNLNQVARGLNTLAKNSEAKYPIMATCKVSVSEVQAKQQKMMDRFEKATKEVMRVCRILA